MPKITKKAARTPVQAEAPSLRKKAVAAAKAATVPVQAEIVRMEPPHRTTDQNTRLLTYDDIMACKPCGRRVDEAVRRFARGCGMAGYSLSRASTQVDEGPWVLAQTRRVPRLYSSRKAHYFETVTHKDIAWAAKRLLPDGWYEIYRSAVDSAIAEANLKGTKGMYKVRMRVRFATFAALYLEAGRS